MLRRRQHGGVDMDVKIKCDVLCSSFVSLRRVKLKGKSVLSFTLLSNSKIQAMPGNVHIHMLFFSITVGIYPIYPTQVGDNILW